MSSGPKLCAIPRIKRALQPALCQSKDLQNLIFPEKSSPCALSLQRREGREEPCMSYINQIRNCVGGDLTVCYSMGVNQGMENRVRERSRYFSHQMTACTWTCTCHFHAALERGGLLLRGCSCPNLNLGAWNCSELQMCC